MQALFYILTVHGHSECPQSVAFASHSARPYWTCGLMQSFISVVVDPNNDWMYYEERVSVSFTRLVQSAAIV